MANQMSPNEYQELGRNYYKLKQYEKAAEAFTNGIEIAPALSLYDHRAAAYDRLQDYNAAVRDGREMIKIDKQDVKGYLRTASILEKMEKPETALSIYKYGMKNVPVSDKNFKLLQQLHDKTTRKLSPATSVDPLTVLPVELAEMVLEYLTFRQLVNCMRVSKGWRDYIAKLPRLWLHLDLSGARRPVPRKFIDKAVRRSENRLTRVTIHRFEHVDILKNVAKTCKGLTELEFITLPHAMSSTLVDIVQHAPQLKTFVVHPQITMDTVGQIVNLRTSLRHVSFKAIRPSNHTIDWKGPFPNLEFCSMHMEKGTRVNAPPLEGLFAQTQSLKSLDLGHLYLYGTFLIPKNGLIASASIGMPLTTLVLHKVRISAFPILPSTLQKLVIEEEGSYDLDDDDERDVLLSRLPALRHLSLIDINMISANWLAAFLDLYMDPESNSRDVILLDDTMPLEHLTIRGYQTIPSCGLFINDRSLLFKDEISTRVRSSRILTPALKHLDIATHPCDDDEIEHLLKHKVSGLTSLDLSHTQITGASIKMLADGLPKLKSIRADNCPRISGRDAIEYALRKGVAVSCSMGEGKGSRKIKYA
ncbi:hypothetical protein BDU57DRAFT_540148 [Ampelomyces quisqualis]|uniref:F-box domain-containing protein n=1 Tax=Ampelomyces quisqualis TaxID=50730 RepID=A0A6A5QH86_AMPQU|nr:hypothetical protein BDU57DRAFT_540148 [Ampelomyces quisqualis]